MSRKADLEQHIRASYDLIREYEVMLQTSPDPKEKARAQRTIQEQWSLIEGYLSEYRLLSTPPFPADIAEIVTHFVDVSEPTQMTSSQDVPPEPAGGATYITHIQHAQGITIGDRAQVISSGRERGSDKENDTAPLIKELVLTLYDSELDDLTDQLTLLIPCKDPTQPLKAKQVSFRLYLLNTSAKMARYIQVEMFVKAHFLAYQYESDPLSIEPPDRWQITRASDKIYRCVFEGGADLVCHKGKWRDLGVVNVQVPCGEADSGDVKVEIPYRIEAEEHTTKGLLTIWLQPAANWR